MSVQSPAEKFAEELRVKADTYFDTREWRLFKEPRRELMAFLARAPYNIERENLGSEALNKTLVEIGVRTPKHDNLHDLTGLVLIDLGLMYPELAKRTLALLSEALEGKTDRASDPVETRSSALHLAGRFIQVVPEAAAVIVNAMVSSAIQRADDLAHHETFDPDHFDPVLDLSSSIFATPTPFNLLSKEILETTQALSEAFTVDRGLLECAIDVLETEQEKVVEKDHLSSFAVKTVRSAIETALECSGPRRPSSDRGFGARGNFKTHKF